MLGSHERKRDEGAAPYEQGLTCAHLVASASPCDDTALVNANAALVAHIHPSTDRVCSSEPRKNCPYYNDRYMLVSIAFYIFSQ